MTQDKAVDQLEEQLRLQRRAFDFVGQLATYKQLGHFRAIRGAYGEAAQALERAAQVAEYLNRPNEEEAIYHSLIAIHEQAGDPEAVIGVYSRLHIHWTMLEDPLRASEYNSVRLELVAQRIGKTRPAVVERLQYEYALAARDLEHRKQRYAKLLRGEEEPTVPDEHVVACDCLVGECVAAGRYGEALRYVSACENTMLGLGAWATGEGIASIRSLKQMIAQKMIDSS
jgi:tetratricopeptide (TPR) repeat protein